MAGDGEVMKSKYTKDELQNMAMQFNQYYSIGDHRARMMLEMLSVVTNTPTDECLKKINALAMGEEL